MKYLISALLLVSSIAVYAAPVSKISPSGDVTGYIDQANIQAALDQAGSNRKAKIKLGKGTFYLNGGVNATGFQGTLFGTGQANSKVVALGSGNAVTRGSVFLFENSHVTIKNLSIEVPEGSSYLDSSPGLGISDGGAAIDIFNGSGSIKNVEILSNGPFGPFGQEALESGILLHNCNGDFEIKNSKFMGVKRAFVYNPETQSDCEIKITNNDFESNRGGVHFLGGAASGNSGTSLVSANTFTDTLVSPFFSGSGIGVEYPIIVTGNDFTHSSVGGNAAVHASKGSSSIEISNNNVLGDYEVASIWIDGKQGSTQIVGNRIDGASTQNGGSIAVIESDNVTINDNDFTDNQSIPGWVVPSFASAGAYALVFSSNVTIEDDLHSAANLSQCQVLHFPAVNPSNQVDPSLIECETGF